MSRAAAVPNRLILGGAIVAAVLLAALASLAWTPFDPTAMNMAGRLQPPSAAHPFGTDPYGRDVLSMVMVGAQGALAVAVAALAVGAGLGVPLGLLAAARPGATDEAVTRAGDVIFAFPAVLVAITIATVFGPGASNAIVAIGVFNVPVFARLTRNSARGLWAHDYVLAARVAGKGACFISFFHILPNLLPTLVVQATVQLSVAVAADAGFAYVGLGAQPPWPSWGRMLQEAQTMIWFAPWLAVFPGLAVALAVLGFSLVGDGLNQWRGAGRN